jgi:hypothetical protein
MKNIVLIRRNREWFQSILSEVYSFWKEVEERKKNPYEKPKKKLPVESEYLFIET